MDLSLIGTHLPTPALSIGLRLPGGRVGFHHGYIRRWGFVWSTVQQYYNQVDLQHRVFQPAFTRLTGCFAGMLRAEPGVWVTGDGA
jgi:hypothetical protein